MSRHSLAILLGLVLCLPCRAQPATGPADPVADGAVLVGSVVEEPAARDVELDGVVVPPPLVVLDCVGCGRVVLVVGFGSAGGAMPGVRPAPKARPIAVPGAGLREAAPLLL